MPELERVGQTSRNSIGGNQKGKRGKNMKTFKKVLASALAAAMVVTAFPVTNAEAATKAKLSTKKATIYVGQSKTIKVTLPKGAKITSVKTSKKAVATVKKSGKKVVVKAVKAGKATVTVKVTPKKGKATNLKATITVKNPTLTVKAAATELAVGETTTVKATATPKKTVAFKSSDETIATVDATGAVKAVKAGTVKITATAGKLSKDVDLTIKNVIVKAVKQSEAKVLVATIAGDGSKVATSDVTITNADNKIVNPVKSVSVNAKDKTQLVIEAYNNMTDGKNYTVKVADKEFTVLASDGKVIDLTIDPLTIDENTLTDINLVPVDANGVKLDKIAYSTAPGKYEFSIDVTKGSGYTSGKQLLLSKAGDEATATVKYTPGTVDANGVYTGVVGPKKIVITAQTPEAVTVSNLKMAIGDANKKFADAKADAKLAKNDTGKAAFFEIKNSKNKELTADEYNTYTVESSDTNVLILGSSKLDAKHAVKLVPVKEGTAYIVLKDKAGVVASTFPVTVSAESKIASLTLDKASATIYTGSALNTADVALTVKDQYGNKVAGITSANVTVECVSVADGGDKTKANTTGNNYFAVANDGSKVTFQTASPAQNVVAGTYTYTIKVVKDKITLQQNVTIKVASAKTTGNSTTYELSFTDGTVDVAFNPAKDNWNAPKYVGITVIKKYDGVPSEVVSAASIKVTKPDGKSYTVDASHSDASGVVSFDADATTNTFAAIQTNAAVATQAAVGTYKLEVIPAGETTKLTRSITVTNSSSDKLAATALKTTVNLTDDGISTIGDLLAKNFRYTYAGKTYEGVGTAANGANYAVKVTGFKVVYSNGTTEQLGGENPTDGAATTTSLTAGTSVSVQTATIQVTLKSADEATLISFDQTVTIGQTISLQ